MQPVNLKGVVLSLIIFCLFSCENQNKKVAHFQEKKEIKAKILVESDLLLDPFSISLVDSLLLVGNLSGVPLLEVYNSFTGKHIKSFLDVGQGPLEVLALGGAQYREEDDCVYLYDLLSRKTLRMNRDRFSANKEILLEPFFNFSNIDADLLSRVGKVTILDDNIFLLGLQSLQGRLGVFNKSDNSVLYFYPITDIIDPTADEQQNAMLFSFDITVRPDKKRIALSTHMADILDIFEYSDQKLDSIWHYQSYLPNNTKTITFEGTPPQIFYTKKSKTGYHDITSSQNNIYALFCGKSEEDGNYYYTNTIRVFDWNGKNTHELISDFPLKRIAVSKNGDRLYGVAANEEGDPIIVYFELD